MCDYSLEHLASRPAKVGDQLVTTKFGRTYTTGFCSPGEPNVAVCIKTGTELAFEREIELRFAVAHATVRIAGRTISSGKRR